MIYVAPEGSRLGPIVFNRNLCGMILSDDSFELPNLSDDTASYVHPFSATTKTNDNKNQGFYYGKFHN